MNREGWKQIRADEWKRRLAAARQIAVRGLAKGGLTPDAEHFDVSALVMDDGEVASLLRPSIAPDHREVFALVDAQACAIEVDFNALVFNYIMDVAETAYRLGLIAGCHLTWPVVESMEAPYGPPKEPKRGKRTSGGVP